MNYCNFAKVIISRSTKDIETINWWNTQKDKENKKERLTNNINMKDRYYNYSIFMEKYPKMYLNFDQFRSKTTKLQSYLSDKKYWQNLNKSGQQHSFLGHFSLKNWLSLSSNERLQHQLVDCRPCSTVHFNFSTLHKSIAPNFENAHQLYEQGTENILKITSPNSNTTTKGMKVIKSIVNIIQPIVEQRLDMKFPRPISDSIMLSPPVTPKELQSTKIKVMQESRKKINESFTDGGNDVNNFLSSSISFREHDRIRLGNFFETKDNAQQRVNKSLEKEKTGKRKHKNHHGQFDSYRFDRTEFLAEIKSKNEGDTINWTALARKYQMTCNDKFPANGGQIIQEYARSKGINTIKFKSKVYKNQRAYFRRVRRAKKVVIVSRTKISLPTPRQSSHLKKDIKVKIASGDLYLGEEIAPKDIISTTITDGKLQQKTTVIHGRKFPLVRLRRIALQEQVSSGVLRYFSDQEYDSLTMDQLTSRYIRIGQKPPAGTLSDKIEHLKLTERTRKIKLWHDHSCILNHSYVCFTISWLYDPANYFTDIEYQEKYKDRKPINVQGIVEKPKLYIFGQSGSSDVEQSSYTAVRIEDLQILSEPITADNGNIKIFDVMRVFSGDGPARQFEIGQQRGGNYPCVCGVHANAHGNFVLCYGISPLTLDERVGLIKSTRCFEELKKGNLNPFQNLKKDDLIEELESRDIDIHNMLRPELQENLSTLLHGICRPPALMTTNPTLSTHHLNLNNYEIFGMEPLHDLSNFIQNIITELPSHISDKKLQKELEEFSKHTIGDKNQIKGSDARLYLVKLSHFLASSQQTDPSIRQMIDSLLEITNISYSKYNTRSPKQILRLYNQSFLLAINCRNVVGVPSKMTSRKFFGSHFHSVSIHLAEVQRIFNLRSLVTEQEERCFGDLRRISENTSNRQPKTVCDNAVLRFTCQQSSKQDSIYIQESIIQKLAKQIQAKPRTLIPSTILKRPILLQSHLERISDYILPGEGVWWHMEDGNMIFHDGPDDEPFHIEGPDMHHFRSSSYKEEHQQLKDIWEKVIENYKRNIITLPLQRIKTFDKDGKVVYITPTETGMYKLFKPMSTPKYYIIDDISRLFMRNAMKISQATT
ncbi:unnamed protein product [Mytilus edulis]|uniref:Uncharacterized protein n=1 Tax=Mytilus edulis TaxID=6550 RepID=A0A8S3SIY3_MYTED|nr:unnamed protein product [Mytilus edulis]